MWYGQSFTCSPGWRKLPSHLWHCMRGRGQRGSKAACSALTPLSVTSPSSHKWKVPSQALPWRCFSGGWAWVHSRTPWAPQTDTPERTAVSSAAASPTHFYSQRFWDFIYLVLEPWVEVCPGLGLVSPQLFPLVFICSECGTAQSASCCIATWALCPCCPWAPLLLTSLDECFFFNSLVVGLPCSSIFWHFWLFFVFRLVVIVLLVVQGGEAYLLKPLSWLEARSGMSVLFCCVCAHDMASLSFYKINT